MISGSQSEKFRHEAMFYAGHADFVAGTAPFIAEGVRAGEPVLVVESREKIELLRSVLGTEAEGVLFADMSALGANPARIIPAWRDFVDEHGAGGRPLRGIGEPIWKGRSRDELAECQRHESLLNVAFGQGQPWWLLCPYDTSQLDAAVIEEAHRSHEFVVQAGGKSVLSGDYRGYDACGAPFDAPLADPGSDRSLRFDRDRLVKIRGEVFRFGTSAGMPVERATQFVTAVNEIATNSIVHGGGLGFLRMWRDGELLIAEVADRGSYNVPLGDRVRPGEPISAARGLWLANELCDLVQIRTLPEGTVVRAQMKIGTAQPASRQQ